MPEISRFFGIIIVMYWSDIGQHKKPHFHAKYNEYSCVFSLPELKILKGNLPSKAMDLVNEWASQHMDELMDNWEKVKNHVKPNQIAPLER